MVRSVGKAATKGAGRLSGIDAGDPPDQLGEGLRGRPVVGVGPDDGAQGGVGEFGHDHPALDGVGGNHLGNGQATPLEQPVARLASLYRSEYLLTFPGPGLAAALVVGGAVLGLAGAFVAVGRHLGWVRED